MTKKQGGKVTPQAFLMKLQVSEVNVGLSNAIYVFINYVFISRLPHSSFQVFFRRLPADRNYKVAPTQNTKAMETD